MNLKIFTDLIEDEALNQINNLITLPAFKDCKVRIMPDVHAGAGCVIGFTANLGNKVIPNIVGVDIGCGMRVIKLGQINLDYALVDKIIKDKVPAGFEVHNNIKDYKLNELYCYNELKNINHIYASLGTLGGGNHFIEIDKDSNNNKYLIIHTGSRNLGKQVADIYQQIAIDYISGKNKIKEVKQQKINELKAEGKFQEINEALKKINEDFANKTPSIPKELCYLENEDRLNYLHDMKICQEFAIENRKQIGDIICSALGIIPLDTFESIHNYISFKDNIVRKGAISAQKGQKLIIPLNMRDGCILGIGKGNSDWNCSAPHGAGRLMSRTKARKNIKLEDFKKSMKDVYSTTVNIFTIDESPFAYKPAESIIDNIQDTISIIDILKPEYNFKASD